MKKLLFILIGLTALYGVIGFLYLPGVINAQLTEQLQKHSGQNFRSTSTSFNPFTFTLEMDDIRVQDKQSEWFKAQSMSINLNAWRLLSGHYTISDFTLNQPLIQTQWDEQGQLIQPVLQLVQSEATNEPIPLNIEQFQIKDGEWQISQSHHLKPTTLSGITFTSEDFQLNQGTAQGELKVQLGKASQVELSVQFDQAAQAVLLNWSLNHLNLAEWSSYLPASVSKPQGTVNSAGQLLWQLDEQPILSIKNLEVEGFGIEVDGMARISEAFIQAENAAVDFNHQAISVDLLATEHGVFQWHSLTPSTAQQPPTESQAAPMAWHIQLQHLVFYETDVELPDLWRLDPLVIDTLKGTNISLGIGSEQTSPTQASEWQASLRQGASALINIQAQQSHQPLTLIGALKVTDWPLAALNPMLFPDHQWQVKQGLFNSQQSFEWRGDQWHTQGHWQINNFELLDAQGLTTAAWPALVSTGGGINGNHQTIYLGNLDLSQAQGFIQTMSNHINQAEQQPGAPSDWRIQIGPFKNNSQRHEAANPEVPSSID